MPHHRSFSEVYQWLIEKKAQRNFEKTFQELQQILQSCPTQIIFPALELTVDQSSDVRWFRRLDFNVDELDSLQNKILTTRCGGPPFGKRSDGRCQSTKENYSYFSDYKDVTLTEFYASKKESILDIELSSICSSWKLIKSIDTILMLEYKHAQLNSSLKSFWERIQLNTYTPFTSEQFSQIIGINDLFAGIFKDPDPKIHFWTRVISKYAFENSLKKERDRKVPIAGIIYEPVNYKDITPLEKEGKPYTNLYLDIGRLKGGLYNYFQQESVTVDASFFKKDGNLLRKTKFVSAHYEEYGKKKVFYLEENLENKWTNYPWKKI